MSKKEIFAKNVARQLSKNNVDEDFNNTPEYLRRGLDPKTDLVKDIDPSIFAKPRSQKPKGLDVPKQVKVVSGAHKNYLWFDEKGEATSVPEHLIDNNEQMSTSSAPEHHIDREGAVVVLDDADAGEDVVDQDYFDVNDPMPGEFVLFVEDRAVASGPASLIEDVAESILYGEHPAFSGKEVSPDKLMVFKRIEFKVGFALKE